MQHFLLTLLLALLITTTTVSANEVWLFGVQEQSFYNQHKVEKVFKVKHYLIDGGRDFEKDISMGLANDKDKAIKQVKQLFLKHKNRWETLAKSSWQGAVNAQALNITKVPAITFDKGVTLIYGVLDVAKAYKIWSKHK